MTIYIEFNHQKQNNKEKSRKINKFMNSKFPKFIELVIEKIDIM